MTSKKQDSEVKPTNLKQEGPHVVATQSLPENGKPDAIGLFKRPKRTLRTLVIEPFMQFKIGAYIFLVSIGFLTAGIALVSYAFVEQYEHVMEIFSVVDPEAKWELVTNDIFYKNAAILGVLSLVYLAVLFVVIFKLTHKVYGPLVAVERFIGLMAAGKYHRRLTIRNKDELQRLASKLNEMADALEKRHMSGCQSKECGCRNKKDTPAA